MTMIDKVSEFIDRSILSSGLDLYEKPLLKITGTGNYYIKNLKTIAHPGHMLPEDLLPGAKSVFAYFLPFKEDIVKNNRPGMYASKKWAQAYVATNRLLTRIAEDISRDLGKEGIRCSWAKPTHNFDEEQLISFWSHKHVAFACGLGSFGKNGLLITKKGCAGRIGTLVSDWDPGFLPGDTGEFKPFYQCPPKCNYCINNCPAGALGSTGLDKKACYSFLLENAELYKELGLCDVCGKCSTGPCGYLNG